MIPKSKDSSNAFLAAVAAGATACSVEFMLMTGGLAGADAPVGTVLWFGLFVFLITWLVAAFGFVLGFLLVGLPAWAGLSALGWMSRGAAVAAGGLLAGLAGGLLGSMGTGLDGGLSSAAFMLVPGAVAGWTLHRVAYGGSKA